MPKIIGKNFFLRFSDFTPQPPVVFLLFFSDCAEPHRIKNSIKKSEATKFGAFVCGKIFSVQKNISKRCFSGVFRQFTAEAKINLLVFSDCTQNHSFSARLGKKVLQQKKAFSNRKKIISQK